MFPNLTYIRLKSLASIIRFGAGGLGASPSLGEAVEVSIESRDKGRYIKTRVYNKAKLDNKESQGRVPSPVLINWHGSGFVIPALGSDHVWCERVARETGVVVIDADYRKGPEDPFPAAVEDCRDVIEWVRSQPDKFDTSKIALSGFSGGGNLALVTSSNVDFFESATTSSPPIKAILAFYPPTNLSIPPEQKAAPSPNKPIPNFIANLFNECYVPLSIDLADPRISPSLIEAEEFPDNVLVISCEGDNLCMEAEELAEKIKGTGKNVVGKRMKGVGHAWDKTVKVGTEGEKAREEGYELAVEFLKASLTL